MLIHVDKEHRGSKYITGNRGKLAIRPKTKGKDSNKHTIATTPYKDSSDTRPANVLLVIDDTFVDSVWLLQITADQPHAYIAYISINPYELASTKSGSDNSGLLETYLRISQHS